MDSDQDLPSAAGLLGMTTAITAAYVTGNRLAAQAVPETIRLIHESLRQAGATPAPPEAKPVPAVRIRQSVTDDYIICLECGAKLRTMRRHLTRAHGMTAEDYRAKWGLPSDYPTVAPSYSAYRSRMAKEAGLGRTAAPKAKPGRGRRRAASR